MPRLWPRLIAALALVALWYSATDTVTWAAQPVPLWEEWFAALNAGNTASVLILMTTEVDEDGVPARRCAGGCDGLDALEAGIAVLVADRYWGEIDRASVRLAGATVTFDVHELSGTPPDIALAISHWRMELDANLIAPACEGVCLRSPTARAALSAAQAPQPSGLTVTPVPVAPPVGGRPTLLAHGQLRPADTPSVGVTGATPAGWVLAGFAAALLALVVSAALDSRLRVQPRPPTES